MAKFCANAAGEILQFAATFQEEDQFQPPAGTVYTLQFDESSNAGLVAAYQANSAQFAMAGGTLTQNGTPATINPDGIAYSGFRNYAAFVSKLKNSSDPLTRGEFAEAFGYLFRLLGRPV